MSTAVIKKPVFVFNGKRYFRGGAEDIKIGTYGIKKTPVFQMNYLDPHHIYPKHALDQVQITVSAPMSINWSRQSRTEVNAGAKLVYVKGAGGTGNFNHSIARTANLKLVKMTIMGSGHDDLINRHSLRYFRSNGRVRLVSAVWIVVDGTLANKFTSGAKVTAKATVNGVELNIQASHSSSTSETIELPSGSTFAYMLHRVSGWNGRGTRRTVASTAIDQDGPY